MVAIGWSPDRALNDNSSHGPMGLRNAPSVPPAEGVGHRSREGAEHDLDRRVASEGASGLARRRSGGQHIVDEKDERAIGHRSLVSKRREDAADVRAAIVRRERCLRRSPSRTREEGSKRGAEQLGDDLREERRLAVAPPLSPTLCRGDWNNDRFGPPCTARRASRDRPQHLRDRRAHEWSQLVPPLVLESVHKVVDRGSQFVRVPRLRQCIRPLGTLEAIGLSGGAGPGRGVAPRTSRPARRAHPRTATPAQEAFALRIWDPTPARKAPGREQEVETALEERPHDVGAVILLSTASCMTSVGALAAHQSSNAAAA